MHHVAVSLDVHQLGDLDGAGLGDTPEIVAPEIHQHHVLRALLRVGEQLGLERVVLLTARATAAGTGDGARVQRPARPTHQHLRRGAAERLAVELEVEHVWGGVQQSQRAVDEIGVETRPRS